MKFRVIYPITERIFSTSSIVSLHDGGGPAAPEVAGVEEGGTPAPQPEAAHRLAQGDGVGAGLLHVTPRHSGLVTEDFSGTLPLERADDY